MTDAECVAFLQWALPQLGRRWAGFRRVRGQVCKRIGRRLAELGVSGLAAYRARLETDPAEWQVLDGLCPVTISRFYRDHSVWETLEGELLPSLARAALANGDDELRCWSLGCASGEEPYTLAIVWTLGLAARYPGLRLRIVATDVLGAVLERAQAAEYSVATVRGLPATWRDQAFEPCDGGLRLRDRFRDCVELRQQDVRRVLPDERFRLILCRNLVFTYFDEARQRDLLARILDRLTIDGALVTAPSEQLPAGTPLAPSYPRLGIYRRAEAIS